MKTEHELKCWPELFQAIVEGKKRFEFRVNDRAFRVGDILCLREWDPSIDEYTGRESRHENTYQLDTVTNTNERMAIMSLGVAL